MDLNKDNVKKIIGIIAFAMVLAFVLQNLATIKDILFNFINIIAPFLYGAAIAFILNIPMSWFEKKLFKPKKMKNGKIRTSKLKRPISILLSFIVFILVISFVIKLIIPQLISVIIMCIKDIPQVAYDVKEWAIDLTRQYPDISNQIKTIEIDWTQITNDMINVVKGLTGSLVTSSIGVVISFIGGIFDTIVAIVFSVYILTSKEKLNLQYDKIIKAYFSEKNAKYILDIGDLSKSTFCNFITGQATEALILGFLCFLGMLIFRLPYSATIAVLVGVTALIPIVGAFIGAIIGSILILSISPMQSVIFIIFLVVLQQIESNLIYPKVVGNSVGLPGMWVLVAVVIGGNLGGVLGLLIGLPLISVVYTIFRNDVNNRIEKKLSSNQEEKLDV